jgi:recombination associated protein RdgC
MKPRNLTLFRFSAAVAADLMVNLPGVVAERPVRSPGPQELHTSGFAQPLHGDPAMTRDVSGCIIFRVGTHDRLLPTASVNQEVEKRVRAIADEEGRKVGGRERKRIKEDVITQMLPHAPVRYMPTDGYVDLANGYLVIDTSSRKRGELVLTELREALGSFPAVPLAPEEGPRVLLTDWLYSRDHLPTQLTLGDECELRDPASNTGAIARFRRQDLAADDVQENLRNGKQVYRLGVDFDGKMRMVLGEDLVIRKLAFDDCVFDDSADDATYDQRATLAILELQRLFIYLEMWFGLPRPQDA